jgi:hypothetical protein
MRITTERTELAVEVYELPDELRTRGGGLPRRQGRCRAGEARAKALVVAAAGDRSRSEHQLATMLGVDPQTIRRWRGKQ